MARARAAWRAGAVAFAAECRAITDMFDTAAAEDREFVQGEVACVFHLAPVTAGHKLGTALAMTARPQLLTALEAGRLGVGQALAVLGEIEHLDAGHADAVLEKPVERHRHRHRQLDLGSEGAAEVELTPGELRSAARRAVLVRDPELARARHERAKKNAGVRGRPGTDGMGQIVIDCTAVQLAIGLAAIKGRAAAMSFDGPDIGEGQLTEGQRQVAAFLHALGCERTNVQAVIECPVERAVDLQVLAHAPVWTVDVRMPAAVALGLSDHPAVLTGYGPLDADQARALLPAADLVRACVDASTGEVLTVDRPVRLATWTKGATTQASTAQARTAPVTGRAMALRGTLVQMATSGGTMPDLSCDGYVPSEALGRLVDLRDVTSVFPGDSTSTRRTDRDHRLPWPLGPTTEWNLQNAGRRWHRAKHTNWTAGCGRRHHPLDRTERPQLRPEAQTHSTPNDPRRRGASATR